MSTGRGAAVPAIARRREDGGIQPEQAHEQGLAEFQSGDLVAVDENVPPGEQPRDEMQAVALLFGAEPQVAQQAAQKGKGQPRTGRSPRFLEGEADRGRRTGGTAPPPRREVPLPESARSGAGRAPSASRPSAALELEADITSTGQRRAA